MQLSKQLLLFRYILKQLGYEEAPGSGFEALRDEFNRKQTGTGATSTTYFASALLGNADRRIEDRLLLAYDEAIQGYEKKLRENRAEPFLSFKYYQWFSLLFTEYFLDQYAHHRNDLINQLNQFRQERSAAQTDDFKHISDYSEADLKKIAYWMATGSGKTLLMHCNYWQAIKYLKDWENVILITPNKGLSQQHYESFTESGIDAKLYAGSEESLKTKEGEVLILEITKLVKEKSGEGVSVDVDYFSESRNLVFIDEGHKGQKSEERAWKNLREHLTRGEGSFTFEYSATFGQIITNNTKDLLQEYGKSIIFDYSYRHFYTDGYGKDFTVFNIDTNKNEDYSEEQNKLLLTASLVGYYEQLVLFEQYKDELRQYNIEKPLWVFVGNTVIGRTKSSLTKDDLIGISDISRVITFFKFALSHPEVLQQDIDKILKAQSGLKNSEGDDIFKNRFEYLQTHQPTVHDILQKVFHGMGSMEAFQVKQADGEIGLKTKTSDHYFGVINIGDVPKYTKKLEEDTEGELIIQDDSFNKSLFQAISDPSSPINILIGSKKFIEGWNSWRVSSMGLMNMGKSEGAQIIQLFGRGVRLKGKGLSLKREEANAPYHVRALQTISMMGLNASYMNRFLDAIEKEVPVYTEYPIEIRYNQEDQWNGQIMTFKTEKGRNYSDELVELVYSEDVARRVTVDLRNKVSVAASGFNSQVAEDANYDRNFLVEFCSFIDYEALALEANRYKLLKGYTNLVIRYEALQSLIEGGCFNLYSHQDQFGLSEALNGKIQDVTSYVVKDYINKLYADKEKAYLSKHLTYEMLDHSVHIDMFPASQQMVVKVPKKHESIIAEIEAKIEELYNKDDATIPTLHFDKHLYSPIASYDDGDKFKEIKTVPVRLNEGERDFLQHLREYVRESKAFENKELFVLRNLSQKGVGFFMESSSFYPDFILWLIDGNKQYIYFLDPKGIQLGQTHFNNPKVIWCNQTAPELERKIQADLAKNQLDISVTISAYILSVTPFDKVKKVWGSGGVTQQEFQDNHILFIEKSKDYLKEVFRK